ncbi:unnamed protein product [Rhizoctonia solani]|uniref:Protein kinase domain-containing protein n=1 Tax=Rhizoctonia solani TaxID=456999 RepID=A0A8H3DMH7_9AGAM|nr:unnamed protein product [Rhizoctonia solani]
MVGVWLPHAVDKHVSDALSRRHGPSHTSINSLFSVTELRALMPLRSFLRRASLSQNKSSGPDHGPIVYEGHKDWVRCVAFSPNGNLVVSGSDDRTIRIWDAHRPSQIRKLKGHSDHVTSVSCSSLGNIIASGSRDHTIRLWDMNTGKQIGDPLTSPDNNHIYSVAFSPGANLIASGSSGGAVRLWDVQRTPASVPFLGHSNIVSSVMFSPDSTRIVSGSYDNTIRIWDIERGRTVVGPLEGHERGVRSIAFSPDGSVIVSSSDDKTLRLWDPRSGNAIAWPYFGHTDVITSVDFAPNGNYITSGAWDRTVRVWDVRADRQMGDAFEKHTNSVYSVAFSPCSSRIVSGSADQTIRIWGAFTPNRNPDIEHDPYIIIGEIEPFDLQNSELISEHLSIQEMFDILTRHGCVDLSSQMNTKTSTAMPVPGARGGFGDILKGGLQSGTKVAIKVWRTAVIEQSNYKHLKRTTREIYYWSKMQHENIHPLMGIILVNGQSLGMVSEWMENGNLHEYIRRNPHVDRHRLCVQVASGLAYMHRHEMIHGDLKALNVLVSSQGDARLTDFGLSAMSMASVAFSPTTGHFGSVRWENYYRKRELRPKDPMYSSP